MKHKKGELQSYCDQWFRQAFPGKYKDFSRLEYSHKYGIYRIVWDSYDNGRRTIKAQNRTRYVWERLKGEIPKGYLVCHKNGDKSDDRIENLEILKRNEMVSKAQTRLSFKKGKRVFFDTPKGLKEHKQCATCKKYFPIKRGIHVRSLCSECATEYARDRQQSKKTYWKNVEKTRKNAREYYHKNKDRINELSKIRYEKANQQAGGL